MILVNFKLYSKSFGEKGVVLAKICKKVMEDTGVLIVPIVSAVDIYRIKQAVDIMVLGQHVDQFVDGKKTGKISAQQLQLAGATGCLLNHSEDKQPKGTLLRIRKILPNDFMSVMCVRSTTQAVFWTKKKVTYIAYEPAELIASKDKSVSSEKPEIIGAMVKVCGDIPLLVGAGVKSKLDVKIALEQGAKGILVSSAVVESDDPEGPLLELAQGFRNN